MSARAMASGTVSFGLVAIPVKLYTTGESANSIHFSMVHRSCGTKLKYQYYCPTDETVVERDEIAKGYEVSKGQYVLFSDEELKALNPEPTNAIEITEFVPLADVDPIYFEKSYYLGPDKGGARPYKLLAKAMRRERPRRAGQVRRARQGLPGAPPPLRRGVDHAAAPLPRGDPRRSPRCRWARPRSRPGS